MRRALADRVAPEETAAIIRWASPQAQSIKRTSELTQVELQQARQKQRQDRQRQWEMER